MGKITKILTSRGVTIGAFVLAAALLLFSSVGGAQAALAYYSETYSTRMALDDIGVTLEENGKSVSWRNYSSDLADGTWDEATGTLLQDMLPEGEQIKPGVKYKEALSVMNSGTIDQYVRVTIYRYWLDKDGNKLRGLSPDLIGLHLTGEKNGWLIDTEASTAERTVLYYSKVLASGSRSPLFADSLTIDGMIASKVTQTAQEQDGYTTITTSYDYDGAQFCVEAKVDAVQEHNAEDAAWSAWGRKVTVNNGTLRLDR